MAKLFIQRVFGPVMPSVLRLIFRPMAPAVPAGLVLLLVLTCLLHGCATVKPYQRVYLNDSQMRLGKQSIAAFDESAQTYREGASGGGNGKASGGCACN